MRAVVLVGGEGTRLRPLTSTRPKPLLPVGQVTMLERKLQHLAAHGITEAVLSLGYKPDAFIDAFGSGSAAGVTLHYATEPAPLDTAGAIRFAAEAAGFLESDETIVAVNGDILTDIDMGAQIALHKSSGARATIALTRVDDPSMFGVVPLDESGAVVAFVEKPKREEAPTDWINAGLYILDRSVFDLIPAGERVSIERVVFPQLADRRELFAIQDPSYWLDAGTPATLIQANLDAVAQGHSRAVHESASVAGVVEKSVVNAGASVAADAVVQGSIVMAGAVIHSGARVENSIVGAGAHVGVGATLLNTSVVGDGVNVGPGTYDDARLS